MPRRRSLLVASLAGLLAVAGVLGLRRLCAPAGPAGPVLLARGASNEPLMAGAARVQLSPPFPVVRAGFRPPRPLSTSARAPLFARALLLASGPVKIALVSLDVLLVPKSLFDRVRAKAESAGASELWLVASHTHSSFGGYDERLASQLAATGAYRQDSVEALVSAAAEALEQAAAQLEPSTVKLAQADHPELIEPRTGEWGDVRLTRLRLQGRARTIAQLVLLSAHPTSVTSDSTQLDPDYPGGVASDDEAAGAVTLVLQSSVGNGSIPTGQSGRRFTRAVSAALATLPALEAGPSRLAFARAVGPLPPPDASRLVPRPLHGAADALLCGIAPRSVELSMVAIGGVKLLAVPGEPSATAVRALEELSGATRVVALANDYIGYIETADWVAVNTGEAAHQYFPPQLLDALARIARLAADSL